MAETKIFNKLEILNQDCGNRGTEPKKKLNKLKSIKLAKSVSMKRSINSNHQPTISYSVTPSKQCSTEIMKASPNYIKATSCSKERIQYKGCRDSGGGGDVKNTMKKLRSINPVRRLKPTNFQVSTHESENISKTSAKNRGKLSNLKPRSASCGQTYPSRLTRKPSLRPTRVLTKIGSLRKSKMPGMAKKSSELSKPAGLSISRATCSSTIKDSKFPNYFDIEQKGISFMEVCPFTYCSLNGHCHASLPPLKRFLSARRCLLKSQRSMKGESLNPHRAEDSGSIKKTILTGQTNPDCAPLIEEQDSNCFIEIYAKPRAPQLIEGDTHGKNGEISYQGLAETLFGETSYPEISFKENLNRVKFLGAEQENVLKFSELEETNLECFRIKKEVVSSVFEATDIKITEEINIVSLVVNDRNNSILNDGQSDLTKNQKQDDFLASKASNDVITSASVRKQLNESSLTRGDGKKDSDPGHESLQGSRFGESDCNAQQFLSNKRKYTRLWRLIYQQIASNGITEVEHEDENLKNIDSRQRFSKKQDAGSKRINKLYNLAFKLLVREALDKIHSKEIKSTGDLYQELSTTPMLIEEMKTESNNGDKVKKSMLRKKSIKQLESRRKFSPRGPRFLELEAHPEAEKVHLRHQMREERIGMEEWMLDYALRQAVDRLAPARKRRVALLVEAFETVTLPEAAR